MSSILHDIRIYLNDPGIFWTDTQVFDAINQAQMWVFAETKWSRTSTPFVLTSGVDIVPIPTGIIIPGWIEGTSTDANGVVSIRRMFPTSQRELENFMRGWRGQSLGQPKNFSIWDSFNLRVFPRPDKTYNYTIWGIGFPIEIINASQNLTGPDNYVAAVQDTALAILLEATRPDLADVYQKNADSEIEEFRKHLRNNQSHNIRRLRFGDRFDIQQSGTIREMPVYYPVEC